MPRTSLPLLSRRLLCLGSVAALGLPVRAQGSWTEGRDYVRLAQPAPVAPGRHVEVLAFFWYGSPHCHAIEPALEAWQRRLPPEAVFRRVPVGFSPVHELHQRAFYALESLHLLEAVHRKLFHALHVQRRSLSREDELADFVASLQLDRAAFLQAMRSATVAAQARQARQLSAAYRIDSVPALGVHGRHYTSAALAGSAQRAFQVADWLIRQAARRPA